MLNYDATTALIVVDMQNDFADSGGSLFVSEGDTIVGPINLEIIRAASAGAFVVYTQDWHPPDTPHFEKDGGIWPVHCVAGSWGAELHPRLVVAGPTVRKGTNGEDGYSGFTMRDPVSGGTSPTPLAGLLQERAVASTVVIGLALDYCVGATAQDSAAGGLDTTVSLRHTAAVDLNPGDGDRMVATLEHAEVLIR
jgi:nicotinamidase/pyrazinamidase